MSYFYCIGLLFSLVSQPEIDWELTYKDSIANIEFNDILPYQEDGFILNGCYRICADTQISQLINVDYFGNIKRRKVYGKGISIIQDLFITPHNNIIIKGITAYYCSHGILFTEMDQNDSTIWFNCTTLNKGYLGMTHTIPTFENDGYIFGIRGWAPGEAYDDYSIFYRTDSFGNPVWIKEYHEKEATIWDLTSMGDGNYLFVGNQIKYVAENIDEPGMILCIDKNGEITYVVNIRENSLRITLLSILATNEGNYFVIGKGAIPLSNVQVTLLYKVDPNGNLLWRKVFGQGNYETISFFKMIKTLDGGLLIVVNNQSEEGVILIRTDAEGNLLWQIKNLSPGYSNDYIGDALALPDGSYILCGGKANEGLGWLVKLGRDPVYDVGVEEEAVSQLDFVLDLGLRFIDVKMGNADRAVLEFYDIKGRRLAEYNLGSVHEGKPRIFLDATKMESMKSSSVLFCRMVTDKGSVTKKVPFIKF
jgi:hypothetical protein